MIKKLIIVLLLVVPFIALAQDKKQGTKDDGKEKKELSLREKAEKAKAKAKAEKAPIELYQIITLERDTTLVDTSLTIQKEYKFNYLRKDNFGLLPFANPGQTYNTLDFGLTKYAAFPEFGFKAKHFNYMEVRDIKYYSVATPMTELFYKSVLEQGQMLDAFITLNTSKNWNFSIAYKGLRSIGKYINNTSSTGNFRFTTSYHSDSKRYILNAHFTAQDMLNNENGGIVNTANFESGEKPYTERPRLDVYFRDATSLLKGNRYFFDHSLRINKEHGDNNLLITHQFNYENKIFEFKQPTVSKRFGNSYLSSNIFDKTRYNKMYNKVGVTYQNSTIGELQFFVDDYRYNYYYNRVTIGNIETGEGYIPNTLNDKINNVGAEYRYQKNKWKGAFSYSKSLSKTSMMNLNANLLYTIDEKNSVSFQYQNLSKLPDLQYNLYQSNYIAYNWSNNFKNEKINTLNVEAKTQWLNVALQVSSLKDHLYFKNAGVSDTLLLISPQQYDKTINYLSVKASREFRVGKFALDNTVLFQKVDQESNVLNVPQWVTRNTLYYSDHLFKRALFLQTGVTFNYFTKYHANDYNPLIGEFYIQNQKEIGSYPTFDFFINAKIRQTRVYLKAEHLNSSFTGYNFYSAPNYPYRDFTIRFGLVWNFFT
ncbi:putative porin [Flavobacterium sp. '19STA2R22 D10 B1']|uniref:putative porin n=1 Tax=Flavobacterium aerium TaxID=3037261 RepID=UPI00278C3F4B|nr:putative porin [Flavobacterium sp. '19STA2R22 D10 B1']